jgi:hypothetical protein
VRWISGIIGFQGFKEWLGVLVVNDVMFSYRSFFSREDLEKNMRFKYFLWSFSMSWMRRRIIILWNPFKTIVCLFSAFYLIITSYLPSHSLCYSLKTTFILSESHQWALRWLHQNRVWRTETIFDKRAEKVWLHRWCDDIPSNPSELQEENNFYNNLIQAYIFVYYYFKHALFILT